MARRRFTVRDIDEILAYWAVYRVQPVLWGYTGGRYGSTLPWRKDEATGWGVIHHREGGGPLYERHCRG